MAGSGIFGQAGSIMFDYEFPQSVSFSKSANWQSAAAPGGLPHPIYTFSLSDSASISLTIRLSHANGGSIVGKLKTMRTMLYPVINKVSNPLVEVVIENYLHMRGHVSSYQESVPDDGGWIGGEPNVVDVSITITENWGEDPQEEYQIP
jgi:hypothetical protein